MSKSVPLYVHVQVCTVQLLYMYLFQIKKTGIVDVDVVLHLVLGKRVGLESKGEVRAVGFKQGT
jgi:hypothetical protein